ncbi:MAG: hypothetical protein HY716_05925 [Planctomycetes bacterium]|nr:hypothetical protein [Planctomycetota bacterium]
MTLLLAGLFVVLAGGFLSLFPRSSGLLGAGGAVAGCLMGLVPAFAVLAGGSPPSLRLPWAVPGGSFHVEIDALSAFFLVPILALSALGAVYGVAYLQAWRGRKAIGLAWLAYNTLVASMILVTIARNVVLFLVAWEMMALASFFLVVFEHEREASREAGWTYLVATHLGTAFLLAFFLMLGRESGSFEFDRLHPPSQAGLFFVLALVGFGTKAGFMPLHVWLPDAHPAAPSHVSALMSGVMIKTGVYGLVRALTFLGPLPAWWGWTLLVVGLTSGLLGVLFALAQHDLKRLLAYHSVENIGIIAMGLGLGLLGLHYGNPVLAVLGFAGALLHVVNHAIFKGLLFLGAGAVIHATQTREMDELGGLMKRMPLTGATFLIGAAAISGLPPLNGFVSEFLIYLGAYRGATSAGAPVAVPSIAAIAGLALIGGLAAACFAKACGVVFLGEPRGAHASGAHEAPRAMGIPMLVLAVACVAIGLLGPLLMRTLAPVLIQVTALPPADVVTSIDEAARPLRFIAGGAGGFLVLAALLALARAVLLSRRPIHESVTWDCGYARPTPRMQYTSSSFAQPLTDLFGLVLRTKRRASAPRGYFPGEAAFASETPDVWRETLWRRLFAGATWGFSKFAWLQQGRVHLYILYIALTLVALLIWGLR